MWILLLSGAASAGPFDTEELVVLGQPAPLAFRWRATPDWGGEQPGAAVTCLVSVTVEDGGGVFTPVDCPEAAAPWIARVLETAEAGPVEELGWGLKAWSRVAITIEPGEALGVRVLPAGTGELPERHHSQVEVRERVEPLYPSDAEWRRVEGDCLVHVRVDHKGRPAQVATVRCTRGFERASVEAVQQWRFKPLRIAGELTVYDTIVPLEYRLATPGDPN